MGRWGVSAPTRKPYKKVSVRYGECRYCGKRVRAGKRGPVPPLCVAHRELRQRVHDLDIALGRADGSLRPEAARELRRATMKAASNVNGNCNRDRPPDDPDRKGSWSWEGGRWRHKGDVRK